jgi:hypothetical protein
MVMPVLTAMLRRIWWRLESFAATVSWPSAKVMVARWGREAAGAPDGVAVHGGA